jgi:hypothetical protein
VQSALEALVRALDVRQHAEPLTVPGLKRAEELVQAWLVADTANGVEAEQMRALFAENVDRDVPWPEREVQWEDARKNLRALELTPESRKLPSPAVASWRLRPTDASASEREIEVMVMMSPIDTEQVQSVTIKPVPVPHRPSTPATQWI